MTEPRESFGQWLRSERAAKNMTRSELAEDTCLSMAAIAQIESGQIKTLSYSTVQKIKRALMAADVPAGIKPPPSIPEPKSKPVASIVHRSVKTSTTVTAWPGRTEQLLTVVTSRLSMTWMDGDICITFDLHRVRTPIGNRRDHGDGR